MLSASVQGMCPRDFGDHVSYLSCLHKVTFFRFDWNVSTIKLISMKFGSDTHISLRLNCHPVVVTERHYSVSYEPTPTKIWGIRISFSCTWRTLPTAKLAQ